MMAHLLFAILHVGHGLEMTLLEYLYRVLLHLLAFGGIAVLVVRGRGFVETLRYTIFAGRE